MSTTPAPATRVNILDADLEESRGINSFTLHFGRGTVLIHHHFYDQFYIGNSNPKQQAIPTETPPILIDTQLCWVKVPEDVETALSRKYQDYGIETGVDPENTGIAYLRYIPGLHAPEHATIQTTPLEPRVDKNDLGGLATLVMDTHHAHPEYDDITDSFEAATHALEQRTQELTGHTASGWFIYDGVDGGLGFARAIYENFEALAERARDQLRDCQCGQPNGCPACPSTKTAATTTNPSSAPPPSTSSTNSSAKQGILRPTVFAPGRRGIINPSV